MSATASLRSDFHLPAANAPVRRAGRQADHVRALYTQTPVSLAGNLVGMSLMVAIFSGLAPALVLAGWAGWVACLWLLRLAHYVRWRRRRDADDDTVRAWRRSWRVLVLLQGAGWGLAVWLFWGLGTPYHTVSLIFVVYSYALASVQLLATQRLVFLVFVSLVFLPTIARIASDDQPWHLQLAGVLTLLFGITLLMARTYGSALAEAIALKRRTDELASQLRVEMSIAEEARRVAEAASRAKTQFFAAASHDLRQPLHAMGLFAEALRQRVQDPELAALVGSINESVDALEGLFGELLDITRIDSGGVDVRPQPMRLEELFARLRVHFEPAAFEKGLMLRFRGGRHFLHADPVIVDRILRNLLSNAIRYTDNGGVLVSCRPRRGRLLLQVWDSGVGISEANLPRIFDEFFQARGQRPLAAHDRKGLGLGLSIVQRLAALMDAPLNVSSTPGRGSTFTLQLAPGRPLQSLPQAVPRTPVPTGPTLQGRLVLVVEDDAAVREGLAVLLAAWGARVASFETLQGLCDWLSSPAAASPDLLLVDYRLPNAATGIEALKAARERFPAQAMPAIVVTGSSLGGHEAEAAMHDFHILIKPVLPARLRSMIAFKLGERVARA